jgi:hypothetical protein
MNREQAATLILMIANALAGAIIAAKPESLGLPPIAHAWIGIAQIAIGTALGFLKSINRQ